MKVYNYHPDYKYYLGFSKADESPLEPGVFLIPANATEKKPPEPQIDKVHIFVNNEWKTIDDLRGSFYSLEPESIGMYIKNEDPCKQLENITTKAPPPKKPTEEWSWNYETEEWEIIPEPEMSPEEKLAAAGLTVEDLKKVLGI
jgi:hypothetical protein